MRALGAVLVAVALLTGSAVGVAAQEDGQPTTTDQLISGMVTEEVEPSVFRVVNDGMRDLSWTDKPNSTIRDTAVRTGHDHSIWVVEPKRFYRLGDDQTYDWPNGRRPETFRVAPDGTVWIVDFGKNRGRLAIRSFDGTEWQTHKEARERFTGKPSRYTPGRAMDVAPDGTVWAAWPNPKKKVGVRAGVVARLDVDGWQRIGRQIRGDSHWLDVFAAEGGDAWAVNLEGGRWWLNRLVDGAWLPHGPDVSEFDIGLDGTVWANRWEPRVANGEYVTDAHGAQVNAASLMRFDGARWHEWAWVPADGVSEQPLAIDLHAAPDGSVWISYALQDGPEVTQGGAVWFDGTTWQYFLPNHEVRSMDLTTDGFAWVLARPLGSPDTVVLYVIGPKASVPAE